MLIRISALLLAFAPMMVHAAEEDSSSMIGLIVANAGFAGWTTIALSVVAFMLVFRMVLELKTEKIMPGAIVDDVEQALGDQDYEGAYGVVQDDPSYLGRVLEGGLSKMNYGYEAIEKGSDEAWESEQTSLMQTASYVQLIGQVAPMLGLFGTVFGMMKAFAVLAHSAGAANPKDLASGIMNSLVTTFIGLLVAIPCNMIYLFIRNKIVSSGLEVGIATNEILGTLRGEEE
ncbi:MAG: MotA/TolQ/ExbB proton channel family protein [Planctomycetes bacterium]|nr:MotA/TolQ/ExbB proton channel family protein [Planctomycetota bacterium]